MWLIVLWGPDAMSLGGFMASKLSAKQQQEQQQRQATAFELSSFIFITLLKNNL